MKIPSYILACFTTASLPLCLAQAQENALGEAIEQEGLTWTVDAVRESNDREPIELEGENLWHPVTDISFDGEDALTVIAPDETWTVARLNTTVNGPILIKFQTKVNWEIEEGQILFDDLRVRFTNQEGGTVYSERVDASKEWTETTHRVRNVSEPLTLSIEFVNRRGQGGQAWIDNLEFETSFPPEVGILPEHFPAPLGKVSKLEVQANGHGTVSFKWFRDGEEVPGENESSILIPADTEAGEYIYQVEVSDDFGTTLSNAALVEVFDISEVLDNEELEFILPDSDSQNYSSLLLKDSNAPDGEDALLLQYVRPGLYEFKTWVESVSTVVEGPVILSYLKIYGPPEDAETDSELEYIFLHDPGLQTVEWNATPFIGSWGQLTIDQVKLSRKPILWEQPVNQTTVVGLDRSIEYDFLSVGETIHQLLKGDELVLETTDPPISLQSLQIEEDGLYRVRIANEFGEELLSESFEITIEDTIGEAVEQPDLNWTYEGEKLWVPQIFETYDGDDAAALLDEGEGSGTVSTQVEGPSLVSFWYKNSSSVKVNDESISLNFSTDDWQQAEIALASEINELKWSRGFFDRLQIEHVELIGEAVEQPDLEWIYQGNRIWIPQSEDTYDGVDAAALLNGDTGNGTASTVIEGPALVSFWWKDASLFEANQSDFEYDGEGWQQVRTVVWNESNTLTWHSGLFDQLEIENLTESPFKLWALDNFSIEEVVDNLAVIQLEDRDFDTIPNLLEWALNKNPDFPNQSIASEIVEVDGQNYLGYRFSRFGDLGSFSICLAGSEDLNNWEKIETVTSETFHEVNNTYTVLMRDTEPLGFGYPFIRLMVTDE